jgi:hypothetical protein
MQSAIIEDIIGVTATAPIAQYQPVQASGAPAVAAGNAMGFATIAAATGARVPVGVSITCLAVAGGAIAVGALVEVHTTVTQVITKAAGVAIGRALNATTNAGDIVEVWPIPN